MKERLEIRGRLLLWSVTLTECEGILCLAERNETEINSGRPVERNGRFSSALQEFAKKQPDYDPKLQKLSHHLAFSKLVEKEYPAFTDCISIRNYCHMLVVILFCQIVKPGNSEHWRVAKNSKHFVETHLNPILSNVFPELIKRKQFDEFVQSCCLVRDQMIGHADGSAFSVVHGTSITSMKLIHTATEKIDYKFMKSFLEPLNRAVIDYAQQNYNIN